MSFVTLNECPPGLFRTEDGAYGFKSEYSTEVKEGVQCDAYCLESGEYFHGGVKTVEERGALKVKPVDLVAELARLVQSQDEVHEAHERRHAKAINELSEAHAAHDRTRKRLAEAEQESRDLRHDRDFFERQMNNARSDLDKARGAACELRGRLTEARANQLVRRGDIVTPNSPDPYDDGIPF